MHESLDTLPTQTRANLPATVDHMDEARAVMDRLERIESLERDGASPAAMLEELRGLVRDAERWVRIDGDGRAREVVARCEAALP